MAAALPRKDAYYCTCSGLLAALSWWPLMEAMWQRARWEQQCALKGPDQCLRLEQYYVILTCDGDGPPGATRVLWCAVSTVLSLSHQGRLKDYGLDLYFYHKTSS